MKKILFLFAAMLLCSSTMKAQSEEKGLSWAVETGIGSEWELGARAQYGINKYLALEGVVKYALDYNNGGNWNEISIQPGVRAFSPEFGPGLKGFAALDLGYGLMFDNNFHISCFALDFSIGLQYKKIYAGYGLGTMHNDGSHKDHLFRVGFYF